MFEIRLLLPLFVALLLSAPACRTGMRLAESGQYDAAVQHYVQKLRGKARKKTEHVRGLESAFARAQQRDFALAQRLSNENNPDQWERIHDLYRQIGRRQSLVRPLLPLRSKDGYLARIELKDVSDLERESREQAAEYLYRQAQDLLHRAEAGDKLAARRALECLTDLERRYYRTYRDNERLKNLARDLGSSYVLFEVRNASATLMPRTLTDRLRLNKTELDTEWKAFYLQETPGWQYDYRAVFSIRQAECSPERISERRYVDECSIEDGWEYILDERGNVRKDSSGNDMRRPRMVVVRAEVLEVMQHKAAHVAGTLEIYDRRNQLLESRELRTEVLFEHYAATYRGDVRALSRVSRERIGSSPMPFPSQEELMGQAIERIKPRLRDELRRSRAIL